MLELLIKLLARYFPLAFGVQADGAPVGVDREDAATEIRRLVWSGFEPPDTIFELVLEGYPSSVALNDVDRQWIRNEIGRQFVDKRQQEETWPESTDWDRLEAAFVGLRATGVIALHDAGMAQSDGFADIAEEYQMRKEVGVSSSGFVFYGGEDVETALAEGELYLTFGAFEKRAENSPIVARQILDALSKRGLRGSWSGDISKRIVVEPINWQKRSPVD